MRDRDPDALPPDLACVRESLYRTADLPFSDFAPGAESKDYGACTFKIGRRRVLFRCAKITPKKAGQFVTLWKRPDSGRIAPCDLNDPVDLVVIGVRRDRRLGQFVFPKALLHAQGVLARDGHGGRLAFRLYPAWDAPPNPNAHRCQRWQLPFFLEMNPGDPLMRARARQLYLA